MALVCPARTYSRDDRRTLVVTIPIDSLLEGENFGKLLIRVAPDPTG